MRTRSAATWLLACLALALGGEQCPTGPPPDPSPGEFVVAAFGDSLTAGAGTAPGYVSALELAEPDWNLLQEGIPGECGALRSGLFFFCSSGGGAQRLRDAVDPLLATPGIDAIVAMWGTNDAFAGDFYLNFPGGQATWEAHRDDYIDDIVEAVGLARARHIDVVYVFPPKTFGIHADVWNPLLQEIQARLDGALGHPLDQMGAVTVDLYAAASADEGMIDPSDGVHFTPEGAAAAAALIEDALAAFE